MSDGGTIPGRLASALADRYRLERELGAGGMATVYLAADLKHDRKVAIKVLKPELAAVLGAERFVQEIKTTAALSHPHILPLFDSGGAGGFLYYVMPYIQGETIRDRLNRETQLGIADAVRIATEVADALDYAHQHGVIHRDIKPENILLHAGRPMVMDFGIALAVSAAAGGRMTETGLSLGTPHYMSPEQATADKQITARSDVYSLASVLFEMLTGEPPHTGSSAQAIIMKIIAEPVQPVTELRRSVPMNVAAALSKALEKLPADRFDSAKAFAVALGDAHFTTGLEFASATGPVAFRQWLRLAWSKRAVAAGTALVALAAGATWFAMRPSTDAPARSMIAAEIADSIRFGMELAITDDGTIATLSSGSRGILVRRAGETEWRGVVTGNVGSLLLSPDGSSLVYSATLGLDQDRRRELRRMSLGGGTTVTLWTAAATDRLGVPQPFAWTADGALYVVDVDGDTSRIGLLPRDGGPISVLWESTGVTVANAAMLPGSRAALLCLYGLSRREGKVVSLDLSSGAVTEIVDQACDPQWSSTGHVLVSTPSGTITAIPFDPHRLRVLGPPREVFRGLAVWNGFASAFRVTADGTLLHVAGGIVESSLGRLVILGPSGARTALGPGTAGGAFSPDGRHLAYSASEQTALRVRDLDLGSDRALTGPGWTVVSSTWSPDGERIAFLGGRNAVDLFAMTLVGDTTPIRLGGGPGGDQPTQWLPDGTILVNQIAFSRIEAYDAGTRDQQGRVVLSASWAYNAPQVSRDGAWMAFLSSEAGRRQLIVRSWPRLERKVVIADSVDFAVPRWSQDGRVIYYQKRDRLLGAEVSGSDSLRVARHRVVVDSLGGQLRDIHPDGRRILVQESRVGGLAPTGLKLIAVSGWLDAVLPKSASARRR